jgi:hypothetical protein
MSFVKIKDKQGIMKIDNGVDLKAQLADGSINEGDLVANVKQWMIAVKDGQGITLEPIKVKDIIW